MKAVFLLCALFALYGYSEGVRPKRTPPITAEISENKFTWDLYKTAAKSQHGNFITGSYAAYYILSEALDGAKGATLRQLKEVLSLPPKAMDYRHLRRQMRKLNHTIKGLAPSGYRFAMKLDGKVNAASLGLITDVTFNGKWKLPFDPQATTLMPFTTNDYRVIHVPTMVQVGQYHVVTSPRWNAEIVVLPYQKSHARRDQIYMYLIQGSRNSLAYTEANIEKLNLADYVSYGLCNVTITVPKFRIESQWDLMHYYKQLGMTGNPFDVNDHTSSEAINIHRIGQKAYLEVDEGIIKAGEFHQRIVPRRTVSINRPFLVVIATKKVVLFAGKVMDPTL